MTACFDQPRTYKFGLPGPLCPAANMLLHGSETTFCANSGNSNSYSITSLIRSPGLQFQEILRPVGNVLHWARRTTGSRVRNRQMVETRVAPRYRVAKAATIEVAGAKIPCTIFDLSITGAALDVSNLVHIPANFTLVVKEDGLRLGCHVVWRRPFRIGVAFDQA